MQSQEMGNASPESDEVKILIVDDEEDIHAITSLSLRGLRHDGHLVKLLKATCGAEAVSLMAAQPDIAVILLDVVMENDHAGLDACREIRKDNALVRILLRTGQPGQAPERETIDGFDIDGYMSKTEVTKTRLYVSVKTALRAWQRLNEISRHRKALRTVLDCAVSLRSFEGPDEVLGKILQACAQLCPAPLIVIALDTFDARANTRRYAQHASLLQDAAQAEAEAARIARQLSRRAPMTTETLSQDVEGGHLVRFSLHGDLGCGYLFLGQTSPDELERQSLVLLAGHAANALYAALTERLLREQHKDVFETMAI